MEDASQYEQMRAIIDDVMPGVENLGVGDRGDGHWRLMLDLVNQDTAEVLERDIASSDGDIRRPELLAKLGWTEQVQEIARRMRALDFVSPWKVPAELKQVEAIAFEVLKGSGFDPLVWKDDAGHYQVCTELLFEAQFKLEYPVLATTRGDVPTPKLCETLGLRALAEELARRLGALGLVPPPLSAEETAQMPAALEKLRQTFQYGTCSLTDVADRSGGGAWDDLSDDRVRREVWKAFEAEVRARVDEEKHWPEVVEADRLEAAFKELNQAGIVAVMGATNTLSSGWSYVRELAAERARHGVQSWAAAFFHEQDLDHALKGHALCIAFGTLEGEDLTGDDLKVAQAIVESLRKHGFEPEWNGSVHTRVTVNPPFTWRRRRSLVDTSESVVVGTYRFSASMLDLLPRVRAVTVQTDDQLMYDLDRMHSRTLETLTFEFNREFEARGALPDLLERVKGRFPRLRELTVTGGRSYTETVRFDG